jgi:hypothetical protein
MLNLTEGAMNVSNCKQFDGISREELNGLRKVLEKQGVEVPEGDDVTVTAQQGVVLRLTYDKTAETLTVCIIDKPFFIPEVMVWSIIDAAMKPHVGP